MISSKFLLGNVLLRGTLQIDAKKKTKQTKTKTKSNLEFLESALYRLSVSLLLINNPSVADRRLFNSIQHESDAAR